MGKQILNSEEIIDVIRAQTGKEAQYDIRTKEYFLEERIIPKKREGFFSRMFG